MAFHLELIHQCATVQRYRQHGETQVLTCHILQQRGVLTARRPLRSWSWTSALRVNSRCTASPIPSTSRSILSVCAVERSVRVSLCLHVCYVCESLVYVHACNTCMCGIYITYILIYIHIISYMPPILTHKHIHVCTLHKHILSVIIRYYILHTSIHTYITQKSRHLVKSISFQIKILRAV